MRIASALGVALLAAPVASAHVFGFDSRRAARDESGEKGEKGEKVGQEGGVLESDLLASIAGDVQRIYQSTQKPEQWSKCNSGNLAVRREWSAFSTPEKESYIAAVKCMSKLPPKTPKDKCPGCRNRYDDFVATHIMQTFVIHNTGNFFVWHRYIVWAYEQTLRKECGYNGTQPYYNWPRWSADPEASPALDGSMTSLGGNGYGGDRCLNQSFYGIPTQTAPLIEVPRGAGGGCVISGPFSDWTINLGPVFTDVTCVPPNPYSHYQSPLLGLGYNPRCIKRDISKFAARATNDYQVTTLLKSPNIETFWYNAQGGRHPFTNHFIGVHTGGHFTIGGDPSTDFFNSISDPFFYCLHAQIDRVWWTWQNLFPSQRTDALFGTTRLLDFTAPKTTLADIMDLGYAYPDTLTIGEAMSTMAGPFCYTYE